MPMSCAAAAWVSFRWRMVRSIRTTSPAFIRCSPASAKPSSANTLPVLGSCLRTSLFGILHRTSQLFEPLPDQFHLRLRRRDPGLGLLLEGVDHVNRLSNRDRLDRAVGSASVIRRNLHYLAAKTMQWLGLNTQFAQLRSVQRVADVVLDRSEEHTSELQSLRHLVCRLLLEKK